MLTRIAERDGAPLRGRWLRLRWSQSLAGQPVRLLARLQREGGTDEHILAAAALGRGAWTWRMPRDLLRLELLAAPEAAGAIRIDALGAVPARRLAAELLRRRPDALFPLLWWRGGDRARSVPVHEALDLAAPEDFARFAAARRRPLEPDGLDSSLADDASRGPLLWFAITIDREEQIADLRATLRAFDAQVDGGFRVQVNASRDFAGQIGDSLGGRLSTVVIPGLAEDESPEPIDADDRRFPPTAAADDLRRRRVWVPGSPAAPRNDGESAPAYRATLLPGDAPCPEAVLLLRAHLAAHPELDVLYADGAVRAETGLAAQLKPDWSPLFQAGADYIGRPCLVRADLIDADVPRRDLPGRIAARRGPGAVGHLKRVLFTLAPACGADGTSRQRHVEKLAANRNPSLRHAEERSKSASRSTHDRGASFETPAVQAPQDDAGGSFRPGSQDDAIGSVRALRPDDTPATLVVPTRDRPELLGRLVASLDAHLPEGGPDLLVVDNGSADGEALALLARLEARPRTTVLRRPGPFNFSALVNAGVAAAAMPVVVLLNNDCELLDGGAIDRLAGLAMRPGIGAVGAKLLYADGTIQHAGIALGLGGEAGHRDRGRPGDHPGALGRLGVPHEVAAVTAACLAVRRVLFLEAGGFDEALPVAYNDVDFCLRLLARGHRNLLEPRAVLRHAESATRRASDGGRREAHLSEAALFRERWLPLLLDDPYLHPMIATVRFRDRLG